MLYLVYGSEEYLRALNEGWTVVSVTTDNLALMRNFKKELRHNEEN